MEEKKSKVVEAMQEWVELIGYTQIVLCFLALCLMATLAPAIDAKTAARIDDARAGIKQNVAAMANVAVKDIHFRHEGDEYYVSSGGTEIAVMNQKVRKIIDGAGVPSDESASVPRDFVVFSISLGGALIFLVCAIVIRHRENRVSRAKGMMGAVVEMALIMTRNDMRRVHHNDYDEYQ